METLVKTSVFQHQKMLRIYFCNLPPSSGAAFLDQEKKAFLETVVTEHLTVMDRSEVTLDDKLSNGNQGIIYAGSPHKLGASQTQL